MRIRLYADEDSMRKELVRALRSRRIDVMTANEAQMIENDDSVHLEFASSQGRVLITYNIKDYFYLHQQYLKVGKNHSGIILAPQQQYSVGEELRRILKIIANCSAEEMQDNIEFLSAWG